MILHAQSKKGVTILGRISAYPRNQSFCDLGNFQISLGVLLLGVLLLGVLLLGGLVALVGAGVNW